METNALEAIALVLTLWIVTHTVAVEIPITAKASKPWSCQLCLSGWVCIASTAAICITGHRYIYVGDQPIIVLFLMFAIWALSVFTEALYTRLRTFFV